MVTSSPGLDCLVGGHLLMDIRDEHSSVGCWCLWCGTGLYDGDRITDDGEPVGFIPAFVARVPDGFHRREVAR